MSTVFFLGAGASAQDGLPVTSELNYGIAAFLKSSRGDGGCLHKYYRELYGITRSDISKATAAWELFIANRNKRPVTLDRLPSLIETLSILDLALQDGHSFGVSRSRGNQHRELEKPILAIARLELSMALGRAVEDAMFNHRTPLAHELITRLGRDDVVVSANWDTLIERALSKVQRKRGHSRYLKESNIRYCAANELLVNYQGEIIKKRSRRVVSVLKLHGSLNWFHCPCCSNLYANVEGNWVVDPTNRRPVYDECHCGAWLESLTIVPSFVKSYQNIHIRSTWHHAQRSLESARRWVFIGYRLPPDDYHIRAMLLRSLRANIARNRQRPPRVVVVGRVTAGEIENSYKDLFRLAMPSFIDGGLKGYLDSKESHRS